MSDLPPEIGPEPAGPTANSAEREDFAVQLYEQLKSLARRYMAKERPNHTLQPTALAHEAYIRLHRIDRVEWRGRTHFMAVAATQMRRVLVEHARAAAAHKRGGKLRRVSLHDHSALTPERSIDLLILDGALDRLRRSSPRQARVAEMRLFSGLEVLEIATVLDVTDRTVKRDWRVARAWLACELSVGEIPGPSRSAANDA